ncbi:MAG: hypothetical protein IPN01_12765 [Deltaproteobacteria bacterium]|nr:hypothetical protein [Deltaproteobacteria bacterium]
MSPEVVVLYEDQRRGRDFWLHELLLQMVADTNGAELWRLQTRCLGVPLKGVSKLLESVREASKIARAGRLMVLVDRDQLRQALYETGRGEPKLPPDVDDLTLTEAVRRRADIPETVQVFLSYPNMEGLIRAIQGCDPSLLPEEVRRALQKELASRELVLAEVKKARNRDLRDCVRRHQPGLHGLALAVAQALTT